MKLSISNIAWPEQLDEQVLVLLKELGFAGLEIAPTRVFPQRPYEDLERAKAWAQGLGLAVPSMQSIWYGRTEQVFGSPEDRAALLDYTKKAVDFAQAVGCRNLVFGCPRNRSVPDGETPVGELEFFRELAEYAAPRGTVIGMEANPPIYNTNYINTTAQALDLVERVDRPGFRVNLDVGTMVANGEEVSLLEGRVGLLSHVHISEPGLKAVEERQLHRELARLLRRENYGGFISVEMGRQEDLDDVRRVCVYVKEVFG